MRYFFTLLLIVTTVLTLNAQQGQRRYDAFSGNPVISVEGGTTLLKSDYNGLGVDYTGRFMFEYFLPATVKSNLGFRLFGAAGYLSGKDESLSPKEFRTGFSSVGGGLVLMLSVRDRFYPYLFAGASYFHFNPKGDDGVKMPNNAAGLYKNDEVNYNGELGMRFLLTENLSFNLSGGVQLSPNDNIDDLQKGTDNDITFTALAGFSFSFFSERDSDGDGIPDSRDLCPDTPSGVKVDETGCPLDSDKDGVQDYMDKCPGTPKDVKVDQFGCPLDLDSDKIPDYMDICPNTPKGVPVDDLGCPYDLDADGVPDYKDKCPGTPYNVTVDDKGCPADSDLDGIADYLDKCPGTPAGEQVDANGCPKVIEQKQEAPKEPETGTKINNVENVTLSAGTSFAFGKSQLLPAAYPELDNLVQFMKKNPRTKWKIEGFTDNIGPDNANQKVSLERAQAVMNYLVSKGVQKNKLQVYGRGKSSPIGDNNTSTGRAQNRRVTITKIGG